MKNIIYLVWNAELWKLFSKDPLPLSKMIVIVKQLFKIVKQLFYVLIHVKM